MRTFRPAAPGSTSRTQPARNPCRAHNNCVQPLRPPEGVLTDGVVSLRVPPALPLDTTTRYFRAGAAENAAVIERIFEH